MEIEKRHGDIVVVRRIDPYEHAWAMLVEGIEAKTTWGRNELKDLMLACLVDGGKER